MIRPRAQWVWRYYLHIIAAGLLATTVGAFFAAQLTLQSDLSALLPENFASVKALKRIKEEVGGVGNLRLLIEDKDITKAIRLADQIESPLLKNPLIKSVVYQNDVDFYQKNALLFLSLDELDSLHIALDERIADEKLKQNPLFAGDLLEEDTDATDAVAQWEGRYRQRVPKPYYTNPDNTVLVLEIAPAQVSTDLQYVRKMVAAVDSIVAASAYRQYAPDLNIYFGGNFTNRLEEYQVIRNDIIGTAAYGLGGIFLLIAVYFRRLLGAILITFALLCSFAWTFGLTYLVLGELNTITGFLFVILLGMGIDYGIHAFARYAESRKAGLPLERALEKLVQRTGKALATTALTTAAAFFSLMLMDFRGFSDLGFIAGVGMLFALVAMVGLLPALITLAEKLGILRFKPAAGGEVRPFTRQSFRCAPAIVLAGVLLTLLAAYSFSKVEFEYDYTDLRANTEQQQTVRQKLKGVFKLADSPAIVLADSDEEIGEIVAAVEQKIAADTTSPTIKTVRSVFSIIPKDQNQKLAKIKAIRTSLAAAKDLANDADKAKLAALDQYFRVEKPFTWDDFPAKDKQRFTNKKGQIGRFVLIYPSVALSNGHNAIAFRNDVANITTASGKVFHASSSNIILADMLLILTQEGRYAVALTFLVVFVVVLLDFRSFKAAAMVLSPLAVGVLWMGLAMDLTAMKFNLFNIIVIPSVIGIGVDNGVHIYHRYREEGQGSLYFV